jgi:hypothetical protein
MKMHLLALENMVMTEQMRNQMMTIIMMLMMTVARRMGGCNGDSNDCGEGATSGTMVGGNNDATSIGNGNGRPSNAPKEEPTKEGPNQGVEIQDNPPLFDKNVNSQVPNVVILAMDNADEEESVFLI